MKYPESNIKIIISMPLLGARFRKPSRELTGWLAAVLLPLLLLLLLLLLQSRHGRKLQHSEKEEEESVRTKYEGKNVLKHCHISMNPTKSFVFFLTFMVNLCMAFLFPHALAFPFWPWYKVSRPFLPTSFPLSPSVSEGWCQGRPREREKEERRRERKVESFDFYRRSFSCYKTEEGGRRAFPLSFQGQVLEWSTRASRQRGRAWII